MLPGASWLHIAVAFVSQRGVDLLAGVLDEVGAPATIEVVVRGAPITEPQAVLALNDRLSADVRVVLGKRAVGFHPKLWMSQTENMTWVLSGSGNLTAGGLRENDEQFELMRFPRTDPAMRTQASDHMTRMKGFFDCGLKLGDAIRTDAWSAWQAQLDEREAIATRLLELDEELAAPDAEYGVSSQTKGNGTLELSATTPQSTVRSWMQRWYPDSGQRNVVWELLAEVLAEAHAHRRAGWAACAVWYGTDVHPRLAVYCGVSQVFVAHSRRGVIFEAPPEHIDSPGYAAAMRLLREIPGAEDEPWGDGGNRHPCVIVPAGEVAAAREPGLQAVRAAIRWRSPNSEEGAAGHGRYHCADLVRAAGRATGRDLDQPGYHPWRG